MSNRTSTPKLSPTVETRTGVHAHARYAPNHSTLCGESTGAYVGGQTPAVDSPIDCTFCLSAIDRDHAAACAEVRARSRRTTDIASIDIEAHEVRVGDEVIGLGIVTDRTDTGTKIYLYFADGGMRSFTPAQVAHVIEAARTADTDCAYCGDPDSAKLTTCADCLAAGCKSYC